MRPLAPRHLPRAVSRFCCGGRRPWVLRLRARLGYDRYMPGVKAVFKKYASAGGKGSSDAPAAVTILDFFDFLDVLSTPRQHATHRTQRNPTYNMRAAPPMRDCFGFLDAPATVRAGHIRAAI